MIFDYWHRLWLLFFLFLSVQDQDLDLSVEDGDMASEQYRFGKATIETDQVIDHELLETEGENDHSYKSHFII